MQASFKHAEVQIGRKMSKEIVTGKWWYTELQGVLRNAVFWRGCFRSEGLQIQMDIREKKFI